ncbi:hypothetical protein ES288_A11G298400v1 [Gossypium darwinii]|uniref:Uncharacterized protein n=1 Tax=Gossypium darwinii TaxID=34276 RepID=A0A5D2ERC9_GOSDA|nr:hypothetical protein ES288_A11G298400v1 [Gossypium darwinii]
MSRFFYDFPSASSCFVVDQSPIEARRILLRVYLICLDRVFVAAFSVYHYGGFIYYFYVFLVVCCLHLLFFSDQGKSVQSGEYVICCWNHCVVVELFSFSSRHLCLWAARFPDDTRKVFASNMYLFCFEIVVLVVVHDCAYGVTQLALIRLIHLMCGWCCSLQNYFLRLKFWFVLPLSFFSGVEPIGSSS